ncbi:MAG: methyltransferase family protein [Chloroflexota bacterium]
MSALSPGIASLFWSTVGAECLVTALVLISIVLPGHRVWPPRQPGAWGQFTMSFLFFISGAGVILLGILDWGAFRLAPWLRAGVGLPLWLAGDWLALWAMVTLGLTSTTGERGALVRYGPYRFSRNPQYVGFIGSLAGWALMTNSLLLPHNIVNGFLRNTLALEYGRDRDNSHCFKFPIKL